MRRIRGSLARLLFLGLILALAGCSPSAPQLFESMEDLRKSVQDERTRLTFIYAGGDSLGNVAISKVVQGFNLSQPEYEIIEITSPPGSPTYDEYLKKMAAMGELSDIIEVRNTQLFAEKGIIQPLDDGLAELLQRPTLVNGEVYAAPLGGRQPIAILYNKDVFASIGITDLPDNWEQFLAICERLKQQGYTPIAVGGKDLWHLGFWQSFFLGSYIYSYNENWNAERKQGKVSFTDDNMMRAMSDMTELWTKGYVNEDWLSVADSEIPAQMVNGRAVMVYHGNWMANSIQRLDPEFPLGAFLPMDREGRTVVLDENTTIGLSMTTGAYADEKKRKGFNAFIRYLYSREVYTEYLRMTRNTDITKQGIVYEEMKDFPWAAEESVYKVRFMHEYWGESAVATEFRDWLWKLMRTWLLTQQPSLDEVMHQADKAFDLYHPN